MNDWNLGERGLFVLTAIEVAILGGISNWLLSDKRERIWFNLLVNIFVSGFVGLLVGNLCLHYEFDTAWSYFIAGASGVSAETILLLFKQCVVLRLQTILKTNIEDMILPKSGKRPSIGSVLIKDYGVDETDIEDAVETQKLSKAKLGDILIKRGVITPEILAAALEIQSKNQKDSKDS